MNIAVFASGTGSNFQALLDKKTEGKLHCAFQLLIGNNSKAQCFAHAKNFSIPTLHLAPSHFNSEQHYTKDLLKVLHSYNINLLVLAGYMKRIPLPVIQEYSHRIINIHPSLLPSFGGKGMYGKHVHQAVIDYGAKITGITVHFVDEEYDHGVIVLQQPVQVHDDDTADSLGARILTVEHGNYWKAIEAIIQNRLRVKGRRIYGTI